MKILLATTNPGKLREIKDILQGLPVELLTLADFPNVPEPDETGSSFDENARLKALYYSDATGLPSVADDSGLEIDELDKAPGIHSARWHGTNYQVKFQKIYELLRQRGVTGSRARFVAAVAFVRDGRVEFECDGIVEGEIAPEPRGNYGFGYDPIFFYPPIAKTTAEVDGAAKAAVSHRGIAFRKFREYLERRPTG